MGKVFTITEGLENMGALKTGGQGSVYKGRRTGAIITAVKLLPTPIYSESADDKNFADFRNEVEKLKKVNEQPNPNVVKILSSGITETGNLPFIEMEFIEGPDLEELLKPPRDPVFTIKETLKLADQLSHALAHCHRVDVKHGDIKSNNVKLNIHTGNYVLLDFGLAVMSDEQRRSSLRHAGAIEFMAPEQLEGHMWFQTDIYSFGIILFELLAGTVPFPLRDKGEIARNMVMVAHMETPPPDLLALRRQALPQQWSEEKKERELQVPDWLVGLIYKCLEKKPEQRFANGMELHDAIVLHSTLVTNRTELTTGRFHQLQLENAQLAREKEDLRRQLQQYASGTGNRDRELAALRDTVAQRNAEIGSLQQQLAGRARGGGRKGVSRLSFYALVLLCGLLTVAALYAWFSGGRRSEGRAEDTTAGNSEPEQSAPRQRRVIGQYKVQAEKAYFHNEPEESTRRSAYMIPSNEAVIDALDEQNGFIYTEFTNNRGQTSKGWLRRRDLVTLEEWNNRPEPEAEPPLTKIEINSRLQQARALLDNNNAAGALSLYRDLAEAEVPEAMFQYGNLALQGRNNAIDCEAALALVKGASDQNYTEAKRTLGFLYLFAGSQQVLRATRYDRCTYEQNIGRGTRLLMEAVVAGDTAAARWLDFHRKGDSPE